jgi:hypothetical protein
MPDGGIVTHVRWWCRAAFAVATALLCCAAAAGTDESRCWSTKDRPLVAGALRDVIEKAKAFLLKAEALPPHPYWPGGSSGITIGVGWDVGYHTAETIPETWGELGTETIARLQRAAGKKGTAADRVLPEVRSLNIPRGIAVDVLERSLRDEYYPLVSRLFPGLDRLPTEAQVVFLSVVFNRGPSMGHDPDWKTAKEVDRRWEMRRMRADVERGDIFGIYAHLGTMKRLWEQAGPRGLPIRRRDEQALIRPLVNQQLRWEEEREKLKAAGLPHCLE